MAPKKKGEPAEDGRTYMNRRISAREFSLHGAGGIVRTEQDPDTPPEAEVEFTARGRVKTFSHEFLASGTVKETTVLVLDRDSFSIVGVAEKPKDPELPLDGEEPSADGDGEAGLD